MVDPNKLALVTPGINRETGGYLDFGVPATVVADILREQRVVPEKCDLNSILFLMTPAEDESRAQYADRQAGQIQEPVGSRRSACGGIANAERDAQRALQRLHPATGLQGDARFLSQGEGQGVAGAVLLRAESLPELAMPPQEAYRALVGNEVDYVSRCGGEGARRRYARPDLPAGHRGRGAGERWTRNAQPMLDYFLAFEESFNRFPGFNYEVQGVYQERSDGRIKFHTYVVRE